MTSFRALCGLLLICCVPGCGLWDDVRDVFASRHDDSTTTRAERRQARRERRAEKAKARAERSRPQQDRTAGDGPDILFVTWDTTRADHIGAYGYHRETTPHLDAFAATGVVFERFIVPMATTLPTHTSLFTSVQPEEHGVVANTTFTGETFVAPEGLVPLPAYLQGAGYRTAGFVSSPPLKRASGIAHGFDDWNEPRSATRRGKDTTNAAIAWLDAQQGDMPLFLWVHYYDPHSPYAPIERLRGHFQTDRTQRKLIAARQMPKALDGHQTERLLNAYDADVLYTDQHFGRLLEHWDATTDGPNSIVVVAGDHGEGLNQHEHLEHGLLWDEQLHTVFMMRAPRLEPGRVSQVVQAVDVAPTVLGQTQLPDAAAYLDQSTGSDVLASDFTARPAISRMSLRQSRLGKTVAYAATTERWKVIVDKHDNTQLYDLTQDPHELEDVSADHPDVAERMRIELRAEIARQRARGADIGAGTLKRLDEQTFEELRAIGYVEE